MRPLLSEISTAELAHSCGQKLTEIVRRPSPNGMRYHCLLNGERMLLSEARKRLENRWLELERRQGKGVSIQR